MNAAPQPRAPADSPRQQPGGGIIDLTSDDEDDEYGHEQVVACQPHIDLDPYAFMANGDVEIVRGLPILPPPPAANSDAGIRPNSPLRRRGLFGDDAYDDDDEVEILPDSPNHPGLPVANAEPWKRPNPQARNNDFFGDYIFDDEMNEEDIVQAAKAIIDLEDYDIQPAIRPAPAVINAPAATIPRRPSDPDFSSETKDECINKILEVFGDICQDHVSGLYDTVSKSSERILAYIVDKIETGQGYPKAKLLKRKRQLTEYEEAAQKYATADRVVSLDLAKARQLIRKIVQNEFLDIPMSYIDAVLNQESYRLFTAYLAFEKAQRMYDPRQPAYSKLKTSRKMGEEFKDAKIEELIRITDDETTKDVYRELQAVRRTREKDDAERQAQLAAALKEEENVQRAIAEGTMLECGCCCDDFPLNRMVHCDNENSDELHWFCRGCALKSAEEEAGSGKYELFCMSMNRCTAGFSRDQRAIFLTESITKVLDGNEQETNLRLAGIVNLARCHACSFAAECPPIEMDFEFRCPNQECREVTCRRCKEKSHTPKTCEEAKESKGLSLHHLVAESMSEGVIRKCNKCTSPFIKEEGCNKMTCSRCGNIQCYVCSKNCEYKHFDDRSRGGQQGNCPLFDNSDERHANDRNKAKKERIAAIRSEYPELTEEELDIKMSEEVRKDDEKRRSNNPGAHAHMHARMGELRARLGGREEGFRDVAVLDFEEMRLRPIGPRLDVIRHIRRRPGHPPAVPEPPLNPQFRPHGHIYDGQVLPDFLDLPPPPLEQDFDDALFLPAFGHYHYPIPNPGNPAAQPANQPGVQGFAPFPVPEMPVFDWMLQNPGLRPGPGVPSFPDFPNAEPAPLNAAAPQCLLPENDVGLQTLLIQQQALEEGRLQRARGGQDLLGSGRAADNFDLFQDSDGEGHVDRLQRDALLRERRREERKRLIDRINEHEDNLRNAQREIFDGREGRLGRRAELDRLMREGGQEGIVLDRAIADIRQNEVNPDPLPKVEEERRGMDGPFQWR